MVCTVPWDWIEESTSKQSTALEILHAIFIVCTSCAPAIQLFFQMTLPEYLVRNSLTEMFRITCTLPSVISQARIGFLV